MEVQQSSNMHNQGINDYGNLSDNFQKDRAEDDQGDNLLNNEVFSKKKNLFRTEIRKKKTRTLLQQKRNKTHNDDNEVLPPFYSEIIDHTFQEFIQQAPNLNLVQQNMKIIRRQIDVDSQETLIMIKNSNLFMKLVEMITWGRGQPYLMFEIAYHIVVNVFAFCDCSDVVLQVVDYLLMRDENGQLIDDRENNALYQLAQTRKQYRLSVLENHIANDEDVDIREYAILLLSNISAEDNMTVLKTILSKSKLFLIIQENIQLKNYTDDMLESIVNILSNLTRKDFPYIDFSDTPDLINAIFPLVINRDIVNTTLMSSFKTIVSLADDEEIHQIINYHYELITQMSCFIISCDTNKKYHSDCCEFILEIFELFCSQFDSLTTQVVELGIFDPIAHLLNQNVSNELTQLCLNTLTAAFSKANHQINDYFLLDTNINNNQYLTRKIVQLASLCQSEVKNAALNCLSQLLAGSNTDQCNLIFDEKLMKTLLTSLTSDSVKKDTVTEIINGLCNLVFIGNLSYSVEQNPYVLTFLKLQGDFILDQIQDNLTEEAYYNSSRLMNLITIGNEEEEKEGM